MVAALVNNRKDDSIMTMRNLQICSDISYEKSSKFYRSSCIAGYCGFRRHFNKALAL